MNRRFVLATAAFLFAAAAAPAQETDAIRVYLAGESSTIEPALDWAGWGIFVLVDDPGGADVLVLNGVIPDAAQIRKRLDEAAGLVLILGPEISPEEFTRATGVEAELQAAEDPVYPAPAAVYDGSVDWGIDWTSSPAVLDRSLVLTPLSTVRPFISGSDDDQWLIWGLPEGNNFVVDVYLGKDENPEFRGWEYYHYLIYQLVVRAAGREPMEYAEYPGAILPRGTSNDALIFVLGILAVVAVSVAVVVWRVRHTPPDENPQDNRQD